MDLKLQLKRKELFEWCCKTYSINNSCSGCALIECNCKFGSATEEEIEYAYRTMQSFIHLMKLKNNPCKNCVGLCRDYEGNYCNNYKYK